MNDEYLNPERPKSIKFVVLWAIVGVIYQALNIYGQLRVTLSLADQMGLTYGEYIDNSLLIFSNIPWPSKFLMFIKSLFPIVPVIEILVLICLAIGIYSGFNWGRKGFLWFSIWKVISYPLLFQRFAFESVIVLMFAAWYFNREEILDYFDVEYTSYPLWLLNKIGNVRVDLAIAILLTVIYLIILIVDMPYYLSLFRQII